MTELKRDDVGMAETITRIGHEAEGSTSFSPTADGERMVTTAVLDGIDAFVASYAPFRDTPLTIDDGTKITSALIDHAFVHGIDVDMNAALPIGTQGQYFVWDRHIKISGRAGWAKGTYALVHEMGHAIHHTFDPTYDAPAIFTTHRTRNHWELVMETVTEVVIRATGGHYLLDGLLFIPGLVRFQSSLSPGHAPSFGLRRTTEDAARILEELLPLTEV